MNAHSGVCDRRRAHEQRSPTPPPFTSTSPCPNPQGPPEKRPRTGSSLVGPPSRAIVLRNMVGPGQVDEDLEEEVRG
jgi:hypothetical protein